MPPMLSIWYADGPDNPLSAPSDVLTAAGLDADRPVAVTLGWTIRRPAWLSDTNHAVRTLMAGYGLAADIGAGRVLAPPTRLGTIPNLVRAAAPDVGVVTGIRRGDALAFGSSLGWGDVLAASAKRLVVEIDEDGPDLGGPPIDGNVVATLPRPPCDDVASSRPADAIDLTIGELVCSLLPDDPTLQFGPGGIGEGIARSIDQPCEIFSGLVSDPIAAIADRGLLAAPAVGAYAWGGEPVHRLAADGMLRLTSVSVTHDVAALSAIPRMVGCNAALQVGLDGAVNVERVGGRSISGIGGHADFCAGASRSVGGVSIVALRSTTAQGASTIVERVDPVSTPRSDIDAVVTEHGIADLRGCDDAERARRIVAVAAPEHRHALQRA